MVNKIMKLEQQVTSLEISQRLKELGVKQESLFYWGTRNSLPMSVWSQEWLIDSGLRIENKYSAFTVAELGEMLPEEVDEKGEILFVRMVTPKWYTLRNENLRKTRHTFEADTEANARGKMLIYLLENKLITLCPKNKNN